MSEYKTIGEVRAEACLEAFHRAMRENPGKPIAELMRIAAAMPAPRFFVEPPMAKKNVALLRNHGKKVKNPNKAAMYAELYRRWKKRRVDGYSVLEEIIREPAPSFYLHPQRFTTIVYETLRKNKKRNNGKY